MLNQTRAEQQQRFEDLIAAGKIRLTRGPLFDSFPSAVPADVEFDRVEGMMLGLAVGDALGITSEGLLPGERAQRHGEIRDYLPNRFVSDRRGYPSDDTQLAFWTLEQLLADGHLDPDHLADTICRRHIFGIGSTVREFIGNRKRGRPWYECGPHSAGNGALMRIAPVLIPYLRSPSPCLWTDTAIAATLTHNDAGSTSCCLAFVSMLWELLRMKPPVEPDWWLDSYVRVAKPLEGNDTRFQPRGGLCADYTGPLWRFIEEQVSKAWQQELSVLRAGDIWYSGAFLLETMPSVLYILMRHGNDPQEAIVRAVNDTKDNDTIAAIVGAAVGALHGKSALPERWVRNLTGRTTDSDDGRVFELLRSAQETWFA
jgi:ADP-ribosylglycohydrolase